MSRRTDRQGRSVTRPLAADEYRELIQTYVDRARSDQSIAERLAEEARQRVGVGVDLSGQDE